MSIFEQEWNSWNPEKMLQNLQKMQQLAGVVSDATAPVEEVTQESLAKERRRLRLKAAGDLSPLAMSAAMESVGRCPRVAGNDSCEAMATSVEKFLRSRDAFALVLIAPPGRGKSWAATWAVAEFTGASMWLPAAECRVGASWDEKRTRAMKLPMLVIDDLGSEVGGEWGAREMASILETRYDRGQRTIVTTNLLEGEIGHRYGERLDSRWSDVRHANLVMTMGKDMRKTRR